MNIKRWMMLAAALVAGLGLLTLTSHAQESDAKAPPAPKRTGRINGDNVNLRGKATLHSEVVGQLQTGDRVTILEEITLKEPKAGEPDTWLRIELPSIRPVWVYSSYVDPDTKSVTANLLNLRSGPGENYSRLGQVAQGAVVKVLETRGDWIRIEPPPGTYCFVAASLVSPDSKPPSVEVASSEPAAQPPAEPAAKPPAELATEPAAKPPAELATEPAAKPPAELATEPATKPPAELATEPATAPATEPGMITTEAVPPTTPEQTEPPPITEVTEVTVVPSPVTPPPTVPAEEPSTTEPAVTEPIPTLTDQSVPPEPTEPGMGEEVAQEEIEPAEPPPKRSVRREGIVRRSVSIQAPTDYVLDNIWSRKTINYLYVPTNNTTIVLKDFYGARVVVTGEEVLDQRWPKTPVMKIDTLMTVP